MTAPSRKRAATRSSRRFCGLSGWIANQSAIANCPPRRRAAATRGRRRAKGARTEPYNLPVKFLLDLAPGVLFLAAYFVGGIYVATAVLIASLFAVVAYY